MVAKTMATIVAILVCISFVHGMAHAGNSEPSEKETQECNQQLARIRAMDESLTPGPTNDLAEYEEFVDEIQHRWIARNTECYARLMFAACGPLGSGRFNDKRQYELARKYALSALENPDAILLTLELELTGHVITGTIGPRAPKEEAFAERRRRDVEARLHAWKRLMDAVDPNWDPDDMPLVNIAPPIGTGLPSGVAPEAIRDATLRAEYEAAIQTNRRKAERYREQYKLRQRLKNFPKRAEHYIIQAYSHPPYDLAELQKSLNEYKVDENTKARILDAVAKDSEKAKE